MLISLDCCVIPDFTEVNESFELLLILCGNCVFFVLYRFLSGNVSGLLFVLDRLLSLLARTTILFLLGRGGFNIDLLKASTIRDVLFSVVESNGFERVILRELRG